MTPRNPYEVAKQIKNIIPEKYHYSIEECVNNIFRAPEIIFQMLQIVVNQIVAHPPKEEWEWKIVSILTTKSIKELQDGQK